MEEVRQKLVAEKSRLEAELASYKAEDPYLSQDRDLEINTTDNDSIENEGHDRVEGARNALKADLSAVLLALQKLDLGTYGKCEVGGEDIEAERLAVNPAAVTCFKHAR